jgi:dienelactone hydrolase
MSRVAWSLLLSAVSLLSVGCGGFGAVRAEVSTARSDDGAVIPYLWAEPPGTAAYPLVLYLDGSGCRSVTYVVAFTRPLLDAGFGVVLPEKRGVAVDDDGRHCSREYLETNDRLRRIADASLVLQAARTRPRWDGRLVVAGSSEGGVIAPAVALAYPSTVAVISLAGGGSSQADELRELEPEGAARAELDATFEAIRTNPVADRTWLGSDNTYKRWASYLWYAPVDDLERIDVPIYVAHGALDTSAPVASADAIARRFAERGKANLTYRRYPSLDHRWSDRVGLGHAKEVVLDTVSWLRNTVPVTVTGALPGATR